MLESLMAEFRDTTKSRRNQWMGLTLALAGVVGCDVASQRAASNDIGASMLEQQKKARAAKVSTDDTLDPYFQLFGVQANVANEALREIEEAWHPGSAGLLVEALRFLRDPEVSLAVIETLRRKTGADLEANDQWYHWVWDAKPEPHPEHARFKSRLYMSMDTRFREYFDNSPTNLIRWDEIIWGGVARDGIPPLKNPKVIDASRAIFLKDSNVVFGVEINGEARAYPKRILAWHEMVKDTVGDISINGVYCTLCEAMVVFETEFQGTHYELGTSGFLFRSNKLMYDRGTKSLWSSLKGSPLVGPLADRGIRLHRREVVTTTWGQWRTRHPATTVLSLSTGYDRDYREDAAYGEYTASEDLMFAVAIQDARLTDKQRVLALRSDTPPFDPLAIDTRFLRSHPVYHDQVNGQPIVVVTQPSSTPDSFVTESRAYASGAVKFVTLDQDGVLDEAGKRWSVTESQLECETTDVGPLPRIASHQAFWFGWVNAFPNTRLVAAGQPTNEPPSMPPSDSAVESP